MAHREYHFDWQVDLNAAPEALWPFVADTNRFNRDTGLPAITHITQAPGLMPGKYRLTFTLFGQRVTWDEEPFEWVYPYRFGVLRDYLQGPVRQMRVQADLTPRPGGGTHLRYQVWARPANLLGHAAIVVQIGLLSARKFIQTFKSYDAIAQRGGTHLDLPSGPIRFAAGGRERLAAARRLIVEQESDAAVYDRLRALLYQADDLALQRLRPYQLADYWSLPRRAVLEAFLRAARAGVLDMRWELICPECRGAAESHTSLSGVHQGAHCNFCNMDFDVDFDRQVEVVFRPNPAVRVIPDAARFCITGPHSEPHRVINHNLTAGAVFEVQTVLEPGHYTLFAGESGGGRSVFASPDGNPQPHWTLDDSGWGLDNYTVSLNPLVRLENLSSQPRHVILERTAWRDDAATAADVTALQVFRDLFSREALRPGEEIGIGSMTLLFTDLRESTRLYRQIGDAPAFGRVREHFDILEKAIADEGGAVVKTIGDAVMAVFRQPIAALRAIQAAQAALMDSSAAPQLILKAGIHSGTCIAVTLNERLDYFGSTVNIAARLPALSDGRQVVCSQAVLDDPEVQAWLHNNQLSVETFRAHIKGFDEPLQAARLTL